MCLAFLQEEKQMINVSVYQKGDIYQLQKMKKFFDVKSGVLEKVDGLVDFKQAHMRTIRDKSGVIAIIGGTLLWPGNMEIWSVTGEDINKYPIAYVKLVRELMERFQAVLKIRRFQSAGLCGNPQLDKWFKSIGFKREAIMEKYGPDGQDYYMYSRVA